jgi:uncharacterized membrane protein YeiH
MGGGDYFLSFYPVLWLTELAFICIVFAAGMSYFISGRLNWQQKVVYSSAIGIIMFDY